MTLALGIDPGTATTGYGLVRLEPDGELVAVKYGVMSIPTLIIFKSGQPVSNIVGFRPKAELKKSLDAALAG